MYKNIDGCRACGSRKLVEILAFGQMPLSNGLLTEKQLVEPEPTYPLTVLFCRDCSLVQIRETVDARLLFPADYPYFSSVSDAWLKHCRENALELIQSQNLGSSSLVVEIASNDGYLLRNYKEKGIPVLGIDPADGPAEVARHAGIPTRVQFFGRGAPRRWRPRAYAPMSSTRTTCWRTSRTSRALSMASVLCSRKKALPSSKRS